MDFLRFLSSGNRTCGFSFSSPIIPLEMPAVPNHDPLIKVYPSPQIVMQPQISTPMPVQMLPPKFFGHIIQQQQELLTECFKMNFQTLRKTSKELSSEKQSLSRKRIKKVNRCQHMDKKHYAKGLCNNCYHRYGRNKKPWNCRHEVLYAAGMCQNCYINRYNKMKRDQKNQLEEHASSQIVATAQENEGKI